ncbi:MULTISPECIES: putative lateral flagellar export/assembly protein LafU [Enterobacter]|jgi:chemotaxis protein MotB|uniref:Lateral flagellar export/assembly protein LafU n=1 Tax=Enterobacter rongchengensis TaxID=3030999 RepID=A0ABV4J9V8_9ENTR|nr:MULTISPECIES: putative lateral flagellar export/assembly protein LafU [Enterobacter]PNL53507.1 putative lateral flagellar export/assembly protein LafU [Enterobacter hormaechei]HCR0840639.1 putative lateral flagellar export/assembly protein LafU [Enterobacter cancerogenus]EKX4010864.1 putative lateral flagellar export/assembly protein LafU [Enterobacter cloacae]ELV3045440.1 putative lateral flagellar export/assembly protein LafU [Enterobacter chengduensis]KJL96720.1 flagellar motor protein B
MRKGRGKEHTTIIKRSSRKSHDAFHGGAWKVAFADFTLAMMALFMVLWIMGAVTEEERKEIVSQLNGESIFNGQSLSPITQPHGVGGKIAVTEKRDRGDHKASSPKQETANMPAIVAKGESLVDVNTRSQREIEDLARIIMKITSAYDAQSNLKIEIVPQGLRILITDDQKREMFQRSSAILTPFFKRLLTEFAPALNKIDNKIIITGHTDATRFRDQDLYNNYNLSGERAMQARKVLTNAGLAQDKVLQVSGMADQMLIDPDNPLSSSNRRIEIMVLTHSASDSLYQFFGQHGEKVIKPIVDKLSQKK